MSGKVHNMEGRLGVGYKKHHHANSTTLCMPFLLLLLSLLHTTGWAGSAGEGKEQTPDPQRRLFVQPINYNTNRKREDKRTGDRILGQTSKSSPSCLINHNLNAFMVL